MGSGLSQHHQPSCSGLADFASINLVSHSCAMDKNKDGKISTDEYTGPAPLFDRRDRNSDGFISSDELPGGLGRSQSQGCPTPIVY